MNLLRPGLPTSFTGMYRLFLRASSASVLHHAQARRHLRKMWRLEFDNAATVLHSLKGGTPSALERRRLHEWLGLWEGQSECLKP
jgi:hypothetical protein